MGSAWSPWHRDSGSFACVNRLCWGAAVVLALVLIGCCGCESVPDAPVKPKSTAAQKEKTYSQIMADSQRFIKESENKRGNGNTPPRKQVEDQDSVLAR